MTRRAGARSPRTIALLTALVLLLLTGWQAARADVPYVTFSPGPTVNVLGDLGDQPIIEVAGQESYRDDGALRLVTVVPSGPDRKVDLVNLMRAWIDPAVDVLPYDAVYQPEDTRSSVREASRAQMTTSQEAATAAAFDELGLSYDIGVGVAAVDDEGPAAERLQPGDQLLGVDGARVESIEAVQQRVQRLAVGETVTFQVLREGDEVQERVRTVASPEGEGSAVLIGLSPCCFDFPVDVSLNISDNIGGPSAGLMFALGIYDVLTPGSLTDGKAIAGTGSITAAGEVGAIGGIRQKLVAAQEDGAELFLVPGANCAEALTGSHDPEQLRLVRADTLEEALADVQAWVEDPDAELKECVA